MADSALVAGLLDQPFKALVLGASGAIGGALVDALRADPHCTQVQTLSRSEHQFDITDPASIAQHADQARAAGPYQLILDATGALSIDGVGPEKSLGSLDAERLAKSFQINAIGPLLALRAFAPLLAGGAVIYAKLSARVGSISDNQKGGWYGYRASKAALNMYLQTAAIELQRKNPQLRVVALQPGTVRSRLSQPFSASVAHLLEPAQSAAAMLAALRTLQARVGAHYVDYQGQTIPW